MVVFNPQKKEIDIKVVYYGPALCGKTTNLKSVHLNLNPHQRGELISLATKDDRTLFFDFLPIQLENIKGFKTRFHIYTVPGQVFYTLTRKAVLTGVDGVIFVADSQNGKMKENIESLNDLKDNLKYYNKTLDSIPLIFQYNKRDLPGLIPIDEMNEQLNSMRAPYFEASALSGKGVMETLTMCCKMVLQQMQNKSKPDRQANPVTAEKTAAAHPAAELPELTLAESNSLTPATSSEKPLRSNDVQPVAETNRTDDLDMSAVKAPPSMHDPSNGPSAAATGAAGIPFRREETGDEIKERAPAPAEKISAPSAMKSEDTKRICPRCSLKFKPNVKQCPICRISLVAEDGGAVIGTGDRTGESTSAVVMKAAGGTSEIDREPLPGYTIADDNHDRHHVEIVSCETPLKPSSHAITIPLVMRIKENNAEVKFELTISINNSNHNK